MCVVRGVWWCAAGCVLCAVWCVVGGVWHVALVCGGVVVWSLLVGVCVCCVGLVGVACLLSCGRAGLCSGRVGSGRVEVVRVALG